jgi:hypothetical protein
MIGTPVPGTSVPAASGTISLQLLVVGGLLAVVFMVACAYCAVVVMSVVSKTSAQRADARQVLGQVGLTLEHLVERLVDLVRGRAQPQGTSDADPSDDHETADSPPLP